MSFSLTEENFHNDLNSQRKKNYVEYLIIDLVKEMPIIWNSELWKEAGRKKKSGKTKACVNIRKERNCRLGTHSTSKFIC